MKSLPFHSQQRKTKNILFSEWNKYRSPMKATLSKATTSVSIATQHPQEVVDTILDQRVQHSGCHLSAIPPGTCRCPAKSAGAKCFFSARCPPKMACQGVARSPDREDCLPPSDSTTWSIWNGFADPGNCQCQSKKAMDEARDVGFKFRWIPSTLTL